MTFRFSMTFLKLNNLHFYVYLNAGSSALMLANWQVLVTSLSKSDVQNLTHYFCTILCLEKGGIRMGPYSFNTKQRHSRKSKFLFSKDKIPSFLNVLTTKFFISTPCSLLIETYIKTNTCTTTTEASRIMKNNRIFRGCDLYVCLLGFFLSIIFFQRLMHSLLSY